MGHSDPLKERTWAARTNSHNPATASEVIAFGSGSKHPPGPGTIGYGSVWWRLWIRGHGGADRG